MGVVVTVKSGFDLGYAVRQAAAVPEKSPLGYYANAAQAGEAPGRWFGPGLRALGLAEGQAVVPTRRLRRARTSPSISRSTR